MEQAVERLAEAHRQAGELRNRYLGLVASGDARWVDVNAVAEDTVQILKPEAQQCNVILEFEAAEDLPKVRARPGQLRQILLNLGLNAVQQMGALGRHGVVKVATGYAPDEPWPVQVRFVDDGPGIHACLWERVFEFGFTTKKDGAGLGLTICEQVAGKLGGRVRVEESHMLWGTTFVVELPRGEGDG
jgi:signal transduction histidine kinase